MPVPADPLVKPVTEFDQLLTIQRMESVNRLAAGVAHEFNNVLQIVRGYVSFARNALPAGTEPYDDLEQALAATDRASGLVVQLLHFARTNDDDLEVADAGEVLHSLNLLLRPILGGNIRIESEVEDDLPPVAASDATLRQALLNLCVNARDAMPDGGVLRLEGRFATPPHGPCEVGETPAGPCVQVVVSDTGSGMSGETLRRLFEPFYTTKPPGYGTGLGLPMVACCVRAAGGAIRVTSAPNAGTRIELLFPRAEPSPEPIPPSCDGAPDFAGLGSLETFG